MASHALNRTSDFLRLEKFAHYSSDGFCGTSGWPPRPKRESGSGSTEAAVKPTAREKEEKKHQPNC